MRARIEVVAPDLLADLDAREDPARGADQLFEQRELAGGQFDLPPAAPDLPGEQVDREILDCQEALRGAGGSARHRLQAGDQLLDEERLGEVIVGPEVQAFEALVQFAPGREQDDRARAIRRSRRLRRMLRPSRPGSMMSSTSAS